MNRVSFLPDGYLEKKGRRRSAVFLGSLLGVVIGGVVIGTVAMRASVKQMQDEHDAVQWQCAQAYRTIQDIRNMRAEQQAIAREAETTAGVLERVPRSNVLSEIARSLPPEVSLVELTLDSATGNAGSAVALKLTGVAPTDAQVNEVIDQLNRSEIFRNIVRSSAKDLKAGQFQLAMTLNPRIDLAAQTPKAESRIVMLDPD